LDFAEKESKFFIWKVWKVPLLRLVSRADNTETRWDHRFQFVDWVAVVAVVAFVVVLVDKGKCWNSLAFVAVDDNSGSLGPERSQVPPDHCRPPLVSLVVS